MNRKARILVVDDSDDNRGAVAELLEANGFAVDTAINGKDALLKLAVEKPDLFLIDITMPEMGGLELLGEIHVDDGEYEAIMMTGHETLDDAKTAMELGAFSYVPKPMQWEVLKDHVNKALGLVKLKKDRLRHLADLEKTVLKRTVELQKTVLLLESQSRRLDSVIDSMQEGLLAVDDATSIVIMNAPMEKILGVRFSECLGRHLADVITDPQTVERLTVLTCLQQGSSVQERIITLPAAGEGARTYQVNVQEVVGSGGRNSGLVMTFLDRTDKIKADQLRTSFLGVVAHELRTPLTIIMNYLSVLDDAANHEIVKDMGAACNRLGRLVGSLISLARLSDASVSAQRDTTHIVNLVTTQANRLAREAELKKVTLHVENRLTSPVAVTDPRFLGIALAGLLDNAVKFNRTGGVVRVTLRNRFQNAVHMITISITDQGQGISDQARAHLFESFTQGEMPLTRHFGGLGTGLFLAKRAVELLGGSMETASVEGEGSCFTLVLPVYHENESPSDLTHEAQHVITEDFA